MSKQAGIRTGRARGARVVISLAFMATGQAVLLGGQAGFAGAAAALARFVPLPQLASSWSALGAALTVIGVVLLLPAVWGQGDSGASEAPATPGWRENAAMVAILVCALALRTYRWDQIPAGVHVDEAINGLNALGILVRQYQTVFFENSDGREALYPYFLAGSFQFFGLNLLAFRIVSLATGVIGIALSYALGRELFGRQAGLLAAFFMAVSKWDLVASRVSHEAVPVPFLAAASALCFLRALRTRRWPDYLACGALLGLGMYSYPAFRTMPLAILAAAGVLVVTVRGFARKHLAKLAVAAAVSLAVAAPMLFYIQGHWVVFTQRMRVTSFYLDPHYDGNVIGTLWSNTLTSISLLFADNMAVYYLPGDAVLDGATALLVVVGLVLCLEWRGSGRSLLMPLWFGLGLVPSILSHAVRLPHALRSAMLISLMPLLAAAGMVWLLRWLPDKGVLRAVAVGVILVAVAAANISTYFGPYAGSAHVYAAFDPAPTEAGRAAAALSQRYDVLVSPLLAEHSSFRLVSYGTRYRRLDEANLVGMQGALNRDIVCIITPFDVERYEDRLGRLKRDFPGGMATEYRSPNGALLYTTYLVRRADVPVIGAADVGKDWGGKGGSLPVLYAAPKQAGLLGWFYQDSGEAPMWLGAPRLVRVDAAPGPGDWAAADFPFSAIWTGELDIPAEGAYELGMEAQGIGWLLLDGRLVASVSSKGSTGEGRGSLRLSAGRHALEARYAFFGGRPRFALFWQPPGGVREAIPPSRLQASTVGAAPDTEQFPRWKWPTVFGLQAGNR